MFSGVNRGNISKVFGELICGSDIPVATGRGKNAPPTRDSGEKFGLPSRSPAKAGVVANLLIIGTIPQARDGGPVHCAAGRGPATAGRRRFAFVELMPQPELLGDFRDSSAILRLLSGQASE